MLYQYVDCCPYCGMKRPLDGATHPSATAPPISGGAKIAAGAHAAERPTIKPDYQPHSPFEHAAPYPQARLGIFTKALLFFAFALLILFALYLIFGERHRQNGPNGPNGDEDVHSSGGRVSFFSSRSPASPPPATSTQPATQARTALQFKDVPDSLRAARASLAQNDLAGAKAANGAALAREAGNSDARAIQRDIATREQRRDSALQSADRCATRRAWACVQQQASEALAIDSGNAQAQSLMERAILATAWTTPGSQSAPATVNTPGSAAQAQTLGSAAPAGNENSADAQQRAILQSGWKNAAPASAAH